MQTISAEVGQNRGAQRMARDANPPAALPSLEATAVVFDGAQSAGLKRLELTPPGDEDVIVDVEWSGVSTGTERLFWTGEMPPFPGLGYPLVPGYEAVGRVIWAGDAAPNLVGRRVFVPGARCYKDAHGLFGAASARLVAPAARIAPIDLESAEHGTLLALAATARHAVYAGDALDAQSILIVGHGALGRLAARIACAIGAPTPTVWEIDPERRAADGYRVAAPDDDPCKDYDLIIDVSGADGLLDDLISRLRPRGAVVLAGFYVGRPSFEFAPAFMKEAQLRIAAEWTPEDLAAVIDLAQGGALSLSNLITHRAAPDEADAAYRTAFAGGPCLKMIVDWRRAA